MIDRTRRGFAAVLVTLAAGLGLAGGAAAAATVDASTPRALIESASQAMLQDLDTNRAKYRKDRTGLYQIVDDILLPNFDVNYAAQQVLGKRWRDATPEQRDRFIKAFYRSLLTTYSDALIDFTADRLIIKPFKGDPAADRATVESEIRRDNGATVAVNYRLRKLPAGWKAWDVVIEGISYVASFREQFGLEVDQKGLDSLIKRLEAEAAGGKSPAKT